MPFQSIRQVYRDFVVDGVPSSGRYRPDKPEIRAWGSWVESSISSAGGNIGTVYQTRATLFSDLTKPANTMAWVTNDPTSSFNGVYQKVGAANTGSWTRLSDLPYEFAPGTDAGAGTANAIIVTTDVPVSESSVVAFQLLESTTASPVTLAINGGAPLTIKTNRGSDASALTAGMDVWGRVRLSDNTFRLLNDQDVAALVAQAETAATDAVDAADAALAAAAGLNLPPLVSGNQGKSLTVKEDLSGYEVGYGAKELYDQMTAYMAGLSLETAEISTAAIVGGTDGNGIFDGFNSLGYVDVAGATSLSTSTPGQLRPSGTTSSVGSGTDPAAGPTGFAGVTLADRSYSLANNSLVTEIRVYSGASRSFKQKIVRRVSGTVYDVVYSQDFEHPGGGWATMTLTTPYLVAATGSYYVATYYASSAFNINTKASAARTAFTGNATGAGLSGWTETTGEIPATTATLLTSIGNMVVGSTGFSFSTPPDWVRLSAFVKLNDAALGTDLLFDFSANGGANWQTLTMTPGYARPGGSIIVLSAQVAITTPIGSVAKWRCRTLNGKYPAALAVGITLGNN